MFKESKALLDLHRSDDSALPARGHSVIIGNQRYIVTAITWQYDLISDPNDINSGFTLVVIDLKKDVA